MSAYRQSCKAVLLGAAVLFPGIAAAAPPARVMSLNICTDQLLLALAPERRIASITFMAREQVPLRHWPQAARIPVNYGSAEEILAARPDLVLAGPFLSPLTRKVLADSGVTLVQVPLAENFAQIATVTRQVAAALHAEARGEVLVAHMNEDLRALARQRPAKPFRIAQWGNGGYVPGVRPGKPTADFLDFTMTRLTFAGAIFLTLMFVLPAVVGAFTGLQPGSLILHFFGGTSLLILVGVVLDVMRQVETQLIQKHYDGFLRKGKVKGRYDRLAQTGAAASKTALVYLWTLVAVLVVVGGAVWIYNKSH